MTHYKYFVLTNSNASLSKRFRVIATMYVPTLEKAQSINHTLDGGIDISQGDIHETHSYGIRVRETESDENYGDREDLKAFYMLNNPNGTPSDLITLTDHYGTNYDVYMIGQFNQSLMGVEIEGADAWFLVQVEFLFVGLTQEGS